MILTSVLERISQTPRTPLFPYTTLFRSIVPNGVGMSTPRTYGELDEMRGDAEVADPEVPVEVLHAIRSGDARSEEHTSELQSRENLVCRLMLEKKRRQRTYTSPI